MSDPARFGPCKVAGEVGERHIADVLTRAGFEVTRATLDEERQGIDLWATKRRSVQVKRDDVAGRTGNAFVEVWGDEQDQRPGWARTCAADWIAYLVADEVIWLRPGAICAALEGWQARVTAGELREVRVPNAAGYDTVGWLVPLAELRALRAGGPEPRLP